MGHQLPLLVDLSFPIQDKESMRRLHKEVALLAQNFAQALSNRSEIMVGPVNLCLWYAQYHRIPNPIMNAHKTELQFIV